ncbi:hypothetical protein NMY22_g16402 [Coprinellus aureogranulatus]|nr:hypothetical protein NMY22_g16402 [Coprinellus aureogranulatus]
MHLLTEEQRSAMVAMTKDVAALNGSGQVQTVKSAEGGSKTQPKRNESETAKKRKRGSGKEVAGGADGGAVREEQGAIAGTSKQKQGSKKAKTDGQSDGAKEGGRGGRGGGASNQKQRSKVSQEEGDKDKEEEEDGESEDDSEEEGKGKGRRRAPKQKRMGWSWAIMPIIRTPGGEVVEVKARIYAPVDEPDSKRMKLDKQGFSAVHNYRVGGITPAAKIMSRAKKLSWYCPELATTSYLLSMCAFIQRNGRTRCHTHLSTDRASDNNDEEPRIETSSGTPLHVVTGVSLIATDELFYKNTVIDERFRNFKRSYIPNDIPAPTFPEKIFPTVGNLTKKELLSFFRPHENGRHYLHCGCELDCAVWDFFLWKVAPLLVSETSGAVESIGTPFDARMRPTMAAFLSSMNAGPGNLDKLFRYNDAGELNDLSNAPQFLKDFWTVVEARKTALSSWKPEPPKPRKERPQPGYVELEEAKKLPTVKFSDDEDTASDPPAKSFHELNKVEGEDGLEQVEVDMDVDADLAVSQEEVQGKGEEGEKALIEGLSPLSKTSTLEDISIV